MMKIVSTPNVVDFRSCISRDSWCCCCCCLLEMVAADLHARVLNKLQAFFVECGTSRTLFARKAVVSSRVWVRFQSLCFQFFPKKDVQNVTGVESVGFFASRFTKNGAC